jgi:hypothetical protein
MKVSLLCGLSESLRPLREPLPLQFHAEGAEEAEIAGMSRLAMNQADNFGAIA